METQITASQIILNNSSLGESSADDLLNPADREVARDIIQYVIQFSGKELNQAVKDQVDTHFPTRKYYTIKFEGSEADIIWISKLNPIFEKHKNSLHGAYA